GPLAGRGCSENSRLPQVSLPLCGGAVLNRLVENSHELGAFGAGGIKGAGFDQPFEHPLVDLAKIDTAAEIKERRKGSSLASNVDHSLDSAFPDVFNGGQTKPDRSVNDGKILLAFIHVRPQNLDAEVPTFREVTHDLVGVTHVSRHERRHKLRRIMRLQVGC